ncbi:phosphotransferase [Streptomyces platensis]|uniref:phosphotransferase n=1 Tax=Streptomyces platensis TaxID=58346 RepID=UPI0036B33C33
MVDNPAEREDLPSGVVLGGRQHVRHLHERGTDVVVKRRRDEDGEQRRSLFVEAALQAAAAACFPGGGAGPVVEPMACDGEQLRVAFHEEAPFDTFLDSPGVLDRAAHVVGNVIATVHGQDLSGAAWAWLPEAAGEHPPLEPIPVDTLAVLSAGTVELAAGIHRQGLAGLLADTLAEESERQVFLHGDLKFDNILAAVDGTAVRIIDWECAGRGMPERDLGALAASLLTETIRRSAVRDDTGGAAESLARIDAETQKAWSAIAALLSGYRDNSRAPGLRTRALVHMTAFGLLCRAHSYTQMTYEFDRLPKLLLKVATNMAVRPETFRARFQ